MNDRVRARPSDQALVATQSSRQGVSTKGFDPSRGVARQTLVNIGRDCARNHAGADCDEEIVGMIRQHSKRLTGGHFTFADDDLNLLALLAERAIDARLIDGLHPNVERHIKEATELRREHKSLEGATP